MVINYETKEIINNFINEHIPEGISDEFYIDCRKTVTNIIEIMIEKDIIDNESKTIEAACLCWKEFLYKKFSLLN
jgi:hypothetical protein